jgi:hypothetical protein
MGKNLCRFAPAVASHWLDLAGGGTVAVLGWWVWPFACEKLGKPELVDKVPQSLIWVLVIAGLLSAFF